MSNATRIVGLIEIPHDANPRANGCWRYDSDTGKVDFSCPECDCRALIGVGFIGRGGVSLGAVPCPNECCGLNRVLRFEGWGTRH